MPLSGPPFIDAQRNEEGEGSQNLPSSGIRDIELPNSHIRETCPPSLELVPDRIQDWSSSPMQSYSDPLVGSIFIASVFAFSNVYGMACRVASSVKSVSIGTASVSVVFGNGSKFKDTCYIEYVESRNMWRAAKYPSQIVFRQVRESELTSGCKDLIVKAGCTFIASAGTPRQISRPVEVPLGLLRYTMRSLGFDIAHKGDLFLLYGPRIARSIRSTVLIAPEVDQFGEDCCTDLLDVEVEDHVLKSFIHVTVGEKVTTVLDTLKSLYRNIPLTDTGRDVVRRKLRSKNGSMVLI